MNDENGVKYEKKKKNENEIFFYLQPATTCGFIPFAINSFNTPI